MTYKDTLYWIKFTSPTTKHVITHAGMTWDSYHRLVGRLVVEGVAFTTGEETVTVNIVADEMGQAGGR